MLGLRSRTLFAGLMLAMPLMAFGLELQREVYVETDEITLDQLVADESLDAQITKSMQTVSLGATPSEDDEVILTPREISTAIRSAVHQSSSAAAQIFLAQASLKIPNEIHVRRAALAFNETHFREQLTEVLKLDCAECKFEIGRIRLPPPLPAMNGVPWRINVQNQHVRGPFNVRVDYRKGTQIVASEYVSGEVRVFRNVAILNKALQLGERIQPEDFAFKKFDTTFWNDSPLNQSELAGGKLRRSLRAQDPVQRIDVERERLIQRGEMVEMHVVEGAVNVGMSGVAEDAGMMGDIIRVLNPQTKKQLSGVVIAKGIVELK